MRWQGGRRSGNVEDRRGMPARGRLGGRGIAGGGIGVIVVLVVAMLLGVDPGLLLQDAPYEPEEAPRGEALRPETADPLADFVSVVLADTEDTWRELFARAGERYREPKLVLFSGAVESACGLGQAAMGPFYCRSDATIYIDLSFYRELRNRFQAPGDFAQAYVIAHEVGHHVQALLGIFDHAEELRSRFGREEANAVSVRVELQADCLAGIWAHHADRARGVVEAGDIEEALGAAAAIGDDRLQRQAGRTVSPDSFTHGSSAERSRWFRRGLVEGSFEACDTFAAERH